MSFLTRILSGLGPHDNAAVIRERLESFRALLEGNNRVLELLADAGEKLGGEYVFDMQYLKSLAADLEEAMQDVVYNLQAITGGRHPKLVDRVWEIAADIRATVDARLVVPKADFVIPFEQIDLELAEVVGDKMARLGEVGAHLGLRVPEGFVVSAYACERFLKKAGIDSTGEEDLAESAVDLQRRVMETPLPRELRRAIRRAGRKLERKADACTFAVRSSALGEDGQTSFAGLYETALGITANGIFDAYKHVVASLFSENVMAYRQRLGLPRTQGLMPVGVLRMVPARAGGVVYSLDPAHPEKDVLVVAATCGLGKTVVDGSARVDTFEISRQPPHRVVSKEIADKDLMYVVEPGRGLQQSPVPAAARRTPVITEDELHELASAALAIERYLKRAQDI
ncbi:MAG: PEP/pyruvate-binding domain-containing protein, partial [Thermoanaerobaculales bacterium]|nr:PEP/pyruvate-binding domain-containing protein [Thermoanaerobaculales bacterium]